MMNDILILMPALDEIFIEQTIKSAIDNSSGLNKIKFGVLEQSTGKSFSLVINSENIQIEKIYTPEPIGIGQSRKKLLKFIKNEKYVLSIDAHTLFNSNWDKELIDRYEFIVSELGNKTMISQPLHWATLDNNKLIIDDYTKDMPPWKLKMDGLFARADDVDKNKDYEIHYSLSCHFLFGYSKNFTDIPFDENIFFVAEEPLLAMRYVTRGYNLVAINYNPMYHLAKHKIRPINDWKKKFNIDKTKNDVLFLIDAITGNYIGDRGSPSISSLEEFKIKSNLSLDPILEKFNLTSEEDLKNIVNKEIGDIFNNSDFWTALYDNILSIVSREPLEWVK